MELSVCEFMYLFIHSFIYLINQFPLLFVVSMFQNEGSVLDLCLEEISKCDIFLSFIGSDIDTLVQFINLVTSKNNKNES